MIRVDEPRFGSRLRSLRKQAGESQRVLADLLGVSVTQISDIEKGRRHTGIDNIIQICQHDCVSADYLLGLIDEPRPLDGGTNPSE